MKFVHQIRRPDGKVDLYLRKKGLPSTKLMSPLPEPGAEAGSALEREIKSLIEQLAPERATPGTLRAALRVYELESARWKVLDESTKAGYRGYLKEFEEALGHLPIAAFTPAFVESLMNLWAHRGYRAANLRRQLLYNVLKPSLINGQLDRNPFDLVGDVARPRTLAEPHIIWPEAVVQTVIEAAIAARQYGIARAVAIARYTGARRGDLVTIGKSARRTCRFMFLSGKRRIKVDQPEDHALTHWLDATPTQQPESKWQAHRRRATGVTRLPPTTLVYNTRNGSYTEDGLGQELAKLIADLFKAGKIDTDAYDLHGLRHTRGVELALAECTDAQGAAMMGHASASSFAQYRRQADKIRMSDDGAAKVIRLRERTASAKVEQQV